jgi:DeoR/GlpR family transcriptional regulator of sugar metabolism
MRDTHEDARMSRTSRGDLLLDRIGSVGHVSVGGLARDLGVTPSTIRRDLARLARDGRIVRTYGGAELRGPSMHGAGDPRSSAKAAIADAAAARVRDGETILISSGSTTLEFARRLVDRQLTVITNALDVASVLIDRPGVELVVLGGVVRSEMHSTLGHIAELALRELRADALYMGIGAIGPDLALMNDSIPEILTDRALRRASRDCIVLADATKFRSVAPAFVFDVEQVTTLITDAGVDPGDVTALRSRGIEVVIAP